MPTKGVSEDTRSLKISTFLLATFLACSRSPLDKNARPDSECETNFIL